jgi:hypothetical protein
LIPAEWFSWKMTPDQPLETQSSPLLIASRYYRSKYARTSP